MLHYFKKIRKPKLPEFTVSEKYKKQFPYLVITFFGLLLLLMGVINHCLFRTVTFEYGNYNFAFYDYSHFRISQMTTHPGTFLQDHFSLTLFYFIPVYWLLNWLTGTYTLIIIQWAMLLIAAWFTYKLIMFKTDNLWLGTGVLVYYFILLGRYTTFSCDVNLAVISACFIPVFLYLFEKKKYSIAIVVFVLSLFSRENIPLWFIFIFIVLIIEHRKDKKAVLLSFAGIFISLVYFILLFKIFIPSQETEETKYTLFTYTALGNNPAEAIIYIINHPVESVKLFFVNHLQDSTFNGVKAEFYFVYLISGGFILLLRPQYLIWFIPVVAQKMLNDVYIRWGISTYYSIEVVTLLPLSVFLVLSKLKSGKIQNQLITFVCLLTLIITIYKLDSRHVKLYWTFNPSKEKFYYKGFYQTQYKIPATQKLLKEIPPAAKVSASNVLLPHLAQRKFIYFFPAVKDAEYIVFSVFDDNYLLTHQQNEKERNRYLESHEWEVIAKEFPVFLLKKRSIKRTQEKASFWSDYKTRIQFCNFEKADTANNQLFFQDNTSAIHAKKIVSEEAFSENASLMLYPKYPYGAQVSFNGEKNLEYVLASVWFKGNSKHANIVVNGGENFYFSSGEPVTETPAGWKKLELGLWIPKKFDLNNLHLYLWNNGSEPIYFDDLQIIKRYQE